MAVYTLMIGINEAAGALLFLTVLHICLGLTHFLEIVTLYFSFFTHILSHISRDTKINTTFQDRRNNSAVSSIKFFVRLDKGSSYKTYKLH